MRVLIIQRIFSNYRKPVFDLLSSNKEIRLLHACNKSGIKQISTSYSKAVCSIKYGKKETQVILFVLRKILTFNPDVIIHEFNPSILSLHLVYFYCKIFKKKLILWGHGFNVKKKFEPKESLKDRIRFFYYKNSDALLLYGNLAKDIISEYVNQEKLFVAPNTIDTRKLSGIRKELEREGRSSIKNRLGIKNRYNLVFIGRLLPDKMPLLLVEVFNKLPDILKSELKIHIIGNGPEFNSLKESIVQNNLDDNFVLYGAIYDDVKNGEILFISDLMVMPGYVGLSVNHSFCFDCPVLTFREGSSGPFHSPEIEYLVHEKTGFMAESMNIDDLCNYIVAYLNNKEQQEKIRLNVRYTAENKISIEAMLSGMIDCIDSVTHKKLKNG